MPRTQLVVRRDTLGLLTAGSIIVNLMQGQANAGLQEARDRLMEWYQRLAHKYGFICREYLALRRVNEDLQRQVREYERITDDLRVRNSQFERRLAQTGGS
jgi:hypothetical protein